jgi:hypothetical protein
MKEKYLLGATKDGERLVNTVIPIHGTENAQIAVSLALAEVYNKWPFTKVQVDKIVWQTYRPIITGIYTI